VQLVLHVTDGHEDQARHHGDNGSCQVTHVRLLCWRNVRRLNCPGNRDLTIPGSKQARPPGYSIEAHRTIVFAALAVSRWIEDQAGWYGPARV
jgi:hypothetical protein